MPGAFPASRMGKMGMFKRLLPGVRPRHRFPGLGARFRRNEDGATSYQEISEAEAARQALLLAHNLVLRHLGLQNEYFKLGLDEEIQPRIAAFTPIGNASE